MFSFSLFSEVQTNDRCSTQGYYMKSLSAAMSLLLNYAEVEKEDSVKISKLQPIEVIGKHINSNPILDYYSRTTIDDKLLTAIQPLQLADAIVYSSGVRINNTGGLESMKTISIRGAGSSRSLVLLDGMPINSSQNSTFDLNNISASLINNIDITKGGASAIWGGNAMGGAIDIQTNWNPKKVVKANLSYGSFGEISGSITGNYNHLNLHEKNNVTNSILKYLSGSLQYISSTGKYPFNYTQFGKEEKYVRENADYNNINASIASKMTIDGWSWWNRLLYNETDKGVPGTMLQGQINNSNTRFNEHNIMFLSSADYIYSNSSKIILSGYYKYNVTKYLEPEKSYTPESNYKLNDIYFIAKYDYSFYGINNTINATLSHSILNGDMMDLSVPTTIKRSVIGIGYNIEKPIETDWQTFSFNLLGRFDKALNYNITNDVSEFSYLVGMKYNWNNVPIVIRGNYSHNFRLPNFNEMYYQNYGNKYLLPEKSSHLSVGITADCFDIFSLNLDGYYIDTKDMITSIPTSPISWSAKNLDNAIGKGIEISLSLLTNFTNHIKTFNLGYSLQKTIDNSIGSVTYNKELPYLPNETFNYLIDFNTFYDLNVGSKGEYSSFRYIQNDNSLSRILPAYWLFDIFISKKYIIGNYDFTIRLECKNLFNVSYELISNYIMPGRQFRATILFAM